MPPDDTRLLRRDAIVLRLAIERRARTANTPPTTARVDNAERVAADPIDSVPYSRA